MGEAKRLRDVVKETGNRIEKLAQNRGLINGANIPARAAVGDAKGRDLGAALRQEGVGFGLAGCEHNAVLPQERWFSDDKTIDDWRSSRGKEREDEER